MIIDNNVKFIVNVIIIMSNEYNIDIFVVDSFDFVFKTIVEFFRHEIFSSFINFEIYDFVQISNMFFFVDENEFDF